MAFDITIGDRPYWFHYLSDGKGFRFNVRHDIISKNGGSVNILVRVGRYLNDDETTTPRIVHVFARSHQVEGGGHYDIDIIEAPTVTDVGTEIIYEGTNADGSFANLNRQTEVKQDSIVNVYSDCTYTGGTSYDYEFIEAGGSKTDTGVYNTGEIERMLNPETDYIIKITNTSTTANGVGHSSMTWYESGE